MDTWRTVDQAQDSKTASCVLLRDLPSRPTQRSCKLSSELMQASAALDQRVFQGSKDSQIQQLHAFQQTWDHINSTIKEVKDHITNPVFNQLQQWAASSSPVTSIAAAASAPGSSGNLDGGDHNNCSTFTATTATSLLPTVALSMASCINTAEAYAQLMVTLKQKGHPVAIVTARETAAGLNIVLGSAMRQLLGSPTTADDVEALSAWWADEWARHFSSSSAGSSKAQLPQLTPAKHAQQQQQQTETARDYMEAEGHQTAASAAAHGTTPSKQRRARSAVACNAATPPSSARKAAAAGSAAAAATPGTTGRQLRARPQQPQTPAGSTTPRTAGSGSYGAVALQAPVLVLQEADGVDMEALEVLISALVEARRFGLPVVLVLGLTSSHSGLLQLLPNGLMRRIQLLLLSLPAARQQVALLFRSLLLMGPLPPLVLGPACSAWLLQHFRDVNCSASMTERVMQVACVEHFRQQPLSCLAVAAVTGKRSTLAAAIASLTRQQVVSCCRSLLARLTTASRQVAPVPAAPAAAAGGAPGRPSRQSSSARSCQVSSQAPAAADGDRLQVRLEDSEAVTAAVVKLQAVTKQHAGSSSPSAAALAAASAVLEDAVAAAMQAYGRWRLGVLLLHLVATFTGAAQQDASLQLAPLFSAASQHSFLTAACKGSLSPCGVLLMKLIGSCHAAATPAAAGAMSSSSSSAAKYPTVAQLSDTECNQLLEKMAALLDSNLKQQAAIGDSKAAVRRSGGRVRVGGECGASSSSSSSSESGSDGDSGDDSDSDSDGPDARDDWPLVYASPDVQQMQQALAALTAAAAAAAAATTIQDSQQQQPQQQLDSSSELHKLSTSFPQQFQQLLLSLPELVQPSTAAAAAAATVVHTPSDATMAVTPALKSVRPKAAGAADSTLTPGSLASRLKRQVRFAPGTPDHHGLVEGAASAGVLASGSTHSTPDDPAVAGLINTPNKRSSSGSGKPKKKLFDPAAVAAAAAAAEGGRSSRKSSKKGEKQKAEVGEIAGSSAALLAAVAAATDAGAGVENGQQKAPVASNSVLVVGNKRMQRLMQMMSSAGAKSSSKDSGSPATPAAAATATKQAAVKAAASAAGGQEHGGSKASAAGRHEELATPPAQQKAVGALHTLHTPQTPLSPGSTRHAAGRPTGGRPAAATVGAAAAGGGDGADAASSGPAARGLLSPGRGLRAGSSRLSKRSAPTDQTQTSPGGPEAMQTDVASPAAGQQQQQHDLSCAAMLGRLLHAVIPKLLLDWCCPSAAVAAGSSSSSWCSPLLAAAGAAAFTFDDLGLLSSLLSPMPRAAVHAALTAPSHRLPGHPEQMGPGWEDTCLAYLLLQQQRDDGLPVSDWFGMFCHAQGVQGLGRDPGDDAGTASPAEDVPGGPNRRRAVVARARAGRKARGYAEARGGTGDDGGDDDDAGADVSLASPEGKGARRRRPNDQNAAAAAAATGSSKKRNDPVVASAAAADSASKGRKQHSKGTDADFFESGQQAAAGAAAVDERQLLEAAARFSQAAAELQLLGVWKATKRRRLAAVQRVFAPECYSNLAFGRSEPTTAGCDHIESLPDYDYGSD